VSTYRQRRNGRLGWFHALLNRELEHRNTKADLAVLRLRFSNECMEHQMAKGDIGRLRTKVGLLDAELAKADKEHDERADRIEAVRALHYRIEVRSMVPPHPNLSICHECPHDWPCPTIRALDGTS